MSETNSTGIVDAITPQPMLAAWLLFVLARHWFRAMTAGTRNPAAKKRTSGTNANGSFRETIQTRISVPDEGGGPIITARMPAAKNSAALATNEIPPTFVSVVCPFAMFRPCWQTRIFHTLFASPLMRCIKPAGHAAEPALTAPRENYGYEWVLLAR